MSGFILLAIAGAATAILILALLADHARPPVKRQPVRDVDGRCTSRYEAMRCKLASGHAGAHRHDGAGGSRTWGGRRGRKRP